MLYAVVCVDVVLVLIFPVNDLCIYQCVCMGVFMWCVSACKDVGGCTCVGFVFQ